MQRASLKTIFGWNTSYEDAMEHAGLPTLHRRRDDLFKSFAIKAWNQDKWRDRWFTDGPGVSLYLLHEDTGHP